MYEFKKATFEVRGQGGELGYKNTTEYRVIYIQTELRGDTIG